MEAEIKRLLDPEPGFKGEFGIWMAALEDARRRTKEAVKDLTSEQMAWKPPAGGNSIGQLLRHIALVELDWILTDICRETDLPADAPALLRVEGPMADPGPRTPGELIALLDYARGVTRKRLAPLEEGEIMAVRENQTPDLKKTFSVRWILLHLVQHEAQHRGQILAVKRMALTR